MQLLTAPQSDLILWAYKRRNPFKLQDARKGLEYDEKHLTHLVRCIESLTPKFLEKETRDATSESVYTLTDHAREIAGNVKAALERAAKAKG